MIYLSIQTWVQNRNICSFNRNCIQIFSCDFNSNENFISQNFGIGSKLLAYAESLGDIHQLIIPSARTDLKLHYEKRGYAEISSKPNLTETEERTAAEFTKATGLKMITLQKSIIKE